MISPTVSNAARRVARGVVVATAAIGVASVLLAIVLVAAGARPLIFRSGSMSPAIPAGSLGFTRSASAADVHVGDVVTVKVDGTRVTHRVVAVDRHGDVALLQLKGDANTAADRTIYPVRDVPRTWFSVPFAGSLVNWLGSPIGGIALAAYLLFAFAVIDARTRSAGRRSATAVGAGILRTRALALATATLTLTGAGFGGWVLPTWALWTDNVNASGATIATGTWDVAAPTSSVNNVTPVANAAGWFKANITVTLTATDPAPSSGVAGIHYKLNGGAEQVLAGANGTVSITTEGTNTLEYWSVDNAGFVETPHHTVTYMLDKTPPPAPSFTSISNDTGATSSDQKTSAVSQTLSGTAEANSVVTVSQGGLVLGTATTNGAGGFTYGPVTLAAGSNTFTATAKDVADNVGPVSANFVVILDTVAPNSVVINPNDSLWHTVNTWTVTASDALTGVVSITTTVNGGSPSTTAATNGVPISPAVLPDGINSVSAYATDVAGNASSASPATATIKVDTVKPTAVLNLTGTVGTNGWLRSGAANVVGSDATSGVANVAYKFDSGSFTTVTSGTGFTIPDGTQNVTFHAVDIAGNVGTDVTQPVKVDSAPPSTTAATSPTPNAAGWNTTAATVTFTPTDPPPGSGVANVQYRTTLNGGTPSSYVTLTGPTYTTPSITAQGTTVVEFMATDLAGNVEAFKSTSVKIDGVKPTAVVNFTGTTGTSPWFKTGSANIVASDAAPSSGIDHVEYQVDGTGTVFSVASGATFTIPDGSHSITYRVVDVAGNVGTNVISSTYQIDSVAPVLINPLPANGATGTTWLGLSCAASGAGANQLCVTATDAAPSSGLAVSVTLLRTSGTASCWNGTAFVAGSACSAQSMVVLSGSQYRSSGLLNTIMLNGTYQATYTATDGAGNSTPLVTTFTIASPPPAPHITVGSCTTSNGSNPYNFDFTWSGTTANPDSFILRYSNSTLHPDQSIAAASRTGATTAINNETGQFWVVAVVNGVESPASNLASFAGQGGGKSCTVAP